MTFLRFKYQSSFFRKTYESYVEDPKVVHDDKFRHSHESNEGSIKNGQPTNCLGVDDVQHMLGQVKLDDAEIVSEAFQAFVAFQAIANQKPPRRIN